MRPHNFCRLAPFAAVLSTVLLAGPAHPEITADARKVVDRYLEATGGRESFLSIRSTRMVAKMSSMGLDGTVTVWARRPNLRASEVHLGPLDMRDGYDGTSAWRTDPGSGRPVQLDGKTLEEARAAGYFENEAWLAPDQGGGSVRMVGVEKDSAGSYAVLEVTPPVGRPRRYYFNQESGLLDRVTAQQDQLAVRTTFSDYRPAAGRLLPFRQLTQIAELPANDLLLIVDSLAVNQAVPDMVFRMPPPPVESARYLKTPGVARVPFRYLGRHVWLKVSVNGAEPADFLYDTGASITVIDSSYAARVGLGTEGKLQAQGAGSAGSASFSRVDSMRVAGTDGDGVALGSCRVAVLSINPMLMPHFWRECAGVIGYDFISRFVNEIDFDHQVLTLHDPKGFQYAGGGTRLPFTLAGTVPAIHMTLDGTYEGEFRLDVGSNSTVDLHSPFVQQHQLRKKVERSIEVEGGGFGGTFRNHLTRMKRIDVGPYGWDEPLVSLSGAESGALASADYAGNVGCHILERFKVTLDYERRAVYLEPGEKYSQPDRFSRAGMQLARHGDAVTAMQVLPGSAAAKAGLETGDRVLSLDGKTILSYTPQALLVLFEHGEIGRKVPMEIERDGKKKKLTLRLAKTI